MNYNPYAAPQAPPPPMPPAPGAGMPQPWEVGEVFGQAWEIFKIHWAVLVSAIFAFIVFCSIPYCIALPLMLDQMARGWMAFFLSPQAQWTLRGLGFVVLFIQSFFRVGLLRIFLAASRGETPAFGDLFGGAPRFPAMLGLNLLLYIPYQLSSLMLFIPAFFLYVATWGADFFVVDAQLGPIEALTAQWRAMEGQWGSVMLFMLLGIVICLSGWFGCCVGLLVTLPIYEVAKAIVFLRITGRGGIAPPLPPPPGGYGGGGFGPPPQGPPPGYGPPPGGWPAA